MALLLIIFIVFGIPSLLCILIFLVSDRDRYLASAFAKERPKLWGKDSASTNEVMYYYITKTFLVCFVGFLIAYIFYIVRN